MSSLLLRRLLLVQELLGECVLVSGINLDLDYPRGTCSILLVFNFSCDLFR
jgi:hypothetical protein